MKSSVSSASSAKADEVKYNKLYCQFLEGQQTQAQVFLQCVQLVEWLMEYLDIAGIAYFSLLKPLPLTRQK